MGQWQSGDVTANGIEIHYTRTGGSGTPLVLNHGATDNGLCWTPVAKALEADHDVVMPDARGHGLSGAPADGYGTAERAADLAGLIEALGLDRPIVGGHSMGAGTALRFAADYPDRLRGAILEDPGFRAADAPARPGGPRQMVLQHKERTRDELIGQARQAHPAWGEEELGPWADSKLQVSANFANAPRTFRREELERLAREGSTNPPGPPPPDQPAEITEWARPRRVGHPVKTLLQPLKLTRGETTLPRAYVYCTVGKEPGSYQAQRAERVKDDPRWTYVELDTGHNLHYTAPEETVRILDELARG
jgi:pimeloyl-ACP methyl ester carboxylesterase